MARTGAYRQQLLTKKKLKKNVGYLLGVVNGILIIAMTLNRRLVAIIVTLIMANSRQMKTFA